MWKSTRSPKTPDWSPLNARPWPISTKVEKYAEGAQKTCRRSLNEPFCLILDKNGPFLAHFCPKINFWSRVGNRQNPDFGENLHFSRAPTWKKFCVLVGHRNSGIISPRLSPRNCVLRYLTHWLPCPSSWAPPSSFAFFLYLSEGPLQGPASLQEGPRAVKKNAQAGQSPFTAGLEGAESLLLGPAGPLKGPAVGGKNCLARPSTIFHYRSDPPNVR